MPDASAKQAPDMKAAPTAETRAQVEQRLAEVTALREQLLAQHAGPGAARMRVEAPHSEFYYGGVAVGTEFTTVPAHLAAAVMTAAAEAGVTITQESES